METASSFTSYAENITGKNCLRVSLVGEGDSFDNSHLPERLSFVTTPESSPSVTEPSRPESCRVPGDPGSALWAGRTLPGLGCPGTHRPLPSLKSALKGHASVDSISGGPDADHLHQERLCTAHGCDSHEQALEGPHALSLLDASPSSLQVNLPVYKHKLEPASRRRRPLHRSSPWASGTCPTEE